MINFERVLDDTHCVSCNKSKLCANSNKEHRCGRDARIGHIYCNPCRLAHGGYNRYSRPALSA
jgi:hypothetical protein